MNRKQRKNLWAYREAIAENQQNRLVLGILVVAGGASIGNLFNWWFRENHVASMPLFLLLTFIFWWGMFRLLLLWLSYLKIKKPEAIEAPAGLSVAIFTTSSPGEPLSMFEKTLAACALIEYPHTTYLLDDTRDPRFREAAEKHGAIWLELLDYPGAKAGKINAALERTTEDFILVLDPDHIPFPNFLHKVLGYFTNEHTGFVQVSQAYYNQYRSFTAKAAAEQTYTFYGPTQMGMHGANSAVAIGANCTFRRTALESIGGHGIGLAEDLVTAIRLHAAGWTSVYNPVVVSRGLVPEDLASFYKQQLKWARGVHEVLFAELPRCWRGLSFWQRLTYFSIGTYYFSGFTMFLFIVIPYFFLWFGWLPANMDFLEFVLKWLPVAITSTLIYLFVQKWLCHATAERGLHWRGMLLKFACWPVFLLGFILSIVNADIPYIPTAKQAVKGQTAYSKLLWFHQFLFFATIFIVVIQRRYFTPEARQALTSGEIWGMVAFAAIACSMTAGGIFAAIQSAKIQKEEPWASVELDKIIA